MKDYQKNFARLLADNDSLFFAQGLRLKDGRPTPYFVNLGLFRTGRLIKELGAYLASMIVTEGLADEIDVIIGPSYKGSALAVATVEALWSEHNIDMLFDYDRKEMKDHGESTASGSFFVTNAIFPKARLFIVDDVVTTMGTKYELLDLIKAESTKKHLDLKIRGVGLAVDRTQTTAVYDDKGRVIEDVKGEDAIGKFTERTKIPVYCLVDIRNMVSYLAEEEIPVMINGIKRPIDTNTLKTFNKYIATYGV